MNREKLGELCERYAERLNAGEEVPVEQFLADMEVAQDAQLYEALQRVRKAHLEERVGSAGEATAPFITEQLSNAPSETVGAVVGPYKLLQEIGQGGMGTVYMAEQSRPVNRRVALKIIKPGMDSRK